MAEALARVFDRYEERYRDGEHIAELVRRTISPTGTQNLLDAVRGAGDDPLRSIAKVLGWLEGPAVDRALTRLLGQPAVRAKVVEYLVRHGERVVDLLIEQLGPRISRYDRPRWWASDASAIVAPRRRWSRRSAAIPS